MINSITFNLLLDLMIAFKTKSKAINPKARKPKIIFPKKIIPLPHPPTFASGFIKIINRKNSNANMLKTEIFFFIKFINI
ncbi:hypothetical protein E5F92_002170 [Flavobacterium columnare]|nr:hypothetical protein [Flavobacterium columnare]MCH4831555.1 hypothetical protein [Flavobacterium columnare]